MRVAEGEGMHMLPKRTLVVADSANQLQRYRRQRLTEGSSLLGAECVTLDRLLRMVAEQERGPAVLLSALAVGRWMADAIAATAEKPGGAAAVWTTAGALRQVTDAVLELRFADIAAPREAASPASHWLQMVRRRYEALLNGCLDVPGAAALLLEALGKPKSERPPVLRDAARLVLVGAPSPETWRGKTFAALARAFPDAQPLPGYAPAPATGLFPPAVIGIMAGERRSPPDGLALDTAGPENIQFRRFSSPECELRTVARDVRRLLGRAEVAAEDVLILAPPGPYTRRLGQLLDTCGVPHDGAGPDRLAESSLGQLVLRLLRCDRNRVQWKDLLAFLASPVVSRSHLWADEEVLSGRRLARLLRRHRLRAGSIAQWAEVLATLSRDLRAEAESLAAADEGDMQVQRLRTQADLLEASAPGFVRFVTNLGAVLPGAGGRDPAAWGTWLEMVLQSEELGIRQKAACTDTDDQAAWHALLDIAREQQQPGSGSLLSAGEYAAVLAAAMAAVGAGSATQFTVSVAIRSPEQVEPCGWQRVFVVGMHEGGLPLSLPDTGLVDAAARAAAGLPSIQAINQRAEQRLLEVLRRAEQTLSLCYSAKDATGRAQQPAILLQRLQAVLTVLDGRGDRIPVFLPGVEQRDKVAHPWCQTLSPAILIPDAESAVTDDEAALVAALDADNAASIGPAAVMRAWWDPDRWGPDAFTPMQEFGPVDMAAGVTPSRLDTFGSCPYRYFAECELGLAEPETPELAPDALETGTALHAALELAVHGLLAEHGSDWFMAPDEAARDRKAEELEACIRQHLAAGFDQIHRLDPAAELVRDSLNERWQRTVRTTVAAGLILVDAEYVFQHNWKCQAAAIREKAAARPGRAAEQQAIVLLGQWEQALARGAAPEPCAKYPSGFASFFTAILKALQERETSRAATFTPVLCEWTFGDREAPLDVDLGEGAPLRLRGTIDRVDLNRTGPAPRLRVADYKSGKYLAGEKDITAGIALQLPAYALACQTRIDSGDLPAEVTRLLDGATPQLQDVRLLGVKAGNNATVTVTPGTLDGFRAQLRQVRDRIATGRLAPLPRKGCPVRESRGFCRLASLCRAQSIPEPWFAQEPAVTPLEESGTAPEAAACEGDEA